MRVVVFLVMVEIYTLLSIYAVQHYGYKTLFLTLPLLAVLVSVGFFFSAFFASFRRPNR